MKKFKLYLIVVIAAFAIITIVLIQAQDSTSKGSASQSKRGNLVQVGSATNNLFIDTKTSAACSVTAIEKYSRFLIYSYDYRSQKPFYVQQDFEIGSGCFEGNIPAKVKVTAKEIDITSGELAHDISWSFEAEGTKGEVSLYGPYIVEAPGCCGASQVDKYYSLKNGKLILSTTIKPLKVSIANSNKQGYIGIDHSYQKSNKNSIATIFYGTDDEGVIQNISVLSVKDGKEEWVVDSLKFYDREANNQELTLFKKDDFKGVSISAKLICRCDRQPLKIILTMNSDSIDIASITTNEPADISFKE